MQLLKVLIIEHITVMLLLHLGEIIELPVLHVCLPDQHQSNHPDAAEHSALLLNFSSSSFPKKTNRLVKA